MWTYRAAYSYWLQQSVFPKEQPDLNAFTRALNQRRRMPKVGFNKSMLLADLSPTWEFLGPRKLPVPQRKYFGQGNVSGRVNGVAFDPKNSNVIYVASAGSGLWKTENGGKDWDCLSDRGDLWENIKFTSVAVSPNDSNLVVVGTGDFPGWLGEGYGLMLTRDGGKSWETRLRRELKLDSVSQILFDPDNPKVITVTAGRHPHGLRGKMYRSEDSGRNWRLINIAPGRRIDWTDVQVSLPFAPGKRHYYATGVRAGNDFVTATIRANTPICEPAEVWHSDDGGVNWTQLTAPPAGSCMGNVSVAPSQTKPETVYLLTGEYYDKQNPRTGHIWVSTQAGVGWSDTTDITNTFPHDEFAGDAYNWSQPWYDFYIRCVKHPRTGQDILYVGLVDLVASVDGGAHWQPVGKSFMQDAKTHNDQHALAVNPRDPNDLIVANDGGVYHLGFNPAQNGWTFRNDMNDGLGMTMFYRIAVDPHNPDWIIGGTQDNATPVSMGDLAQWSNRGKGDGGFCAINPTNSDIQYATSYDFRIYRTADRWKTDDELFPPVGGDERVGFIAPLTLDPSNPGRLYAGTNFLHRWDEATGQWSSRLGEQELASGKGFISFIAVAPKDPERIYTGSSMGDLWMTKNGGDDWERIDNDDTRGSSPALPVTSIAVHPTNPNSILVGYGSTQAHAHVWRCPDTTADEIRWMPVGGPGSGSGSLPFVPLNAVIIDPSNADTTYYAATDIGVFVTRDGGATWADFGSTLGLPNVRVTDLHLMPDGRRLVAATFGRGAWAIDMPTERRALLFRPAVDLFQRVKRRFRRAR
jgi:photosystem II stability/assembly factor-like uncharacterized protein